MTPEQIARCKQEFDSFLENHAKKLPGKVLFAKLWGSWSHDCAKPDSDFDFKAVYALPPSDFHGLRRVDETVDHKKPDWEAHELGKFCRLLLSGNPGIVECLFTDAFFVSCWPFNDLRSQRMRFLTEQAVVAYTGYAKGQLGRYRAGRSVHSKQGEPGEKWLYHLVRLLNDAERISMGQPPDVWKTGAEREFLMKIRNEEVALDEVADKAEADLRSIEARRSEWKVAPPVDEDWLHSWLVDAREVHAADVVEGRSGGIDVWTYDKLHD